MIYIRCVYPLHYLLYVIRTVYIQSLKKSRNDDKRGVSLTERGIHVVQINPYRNGHTKDCNNLYDVCSIRV